MTGEAKREGGALPSCLYDMRIIRKPTRTIPMMTMDGIIMERSVRCRIEYMFGS